MDRQRLAVFVVFALNGAVLGSWAPRVPALTAQVQAAPGEFGLALLGGSVGMVLAAAISGRLLEWAGSRALIVLASGVRADPLIHYRSGWSSAHSPSTCSTMRGVSGRRGTRRPVVDVREAP